MFYTFSKSIQESLNLPEIIYTKNIRDGNLRLRSVANQVFHFENGKTVYLKDWLAGFHEEGYQFTEKEQTMLVLKAQIL